MSNQIEFRLHNIEELLSQIDGQADVGKKAVQYTISDIKSRAPGWIASETASVYNIKKSDINPSRIERSNGKEAAVSVSVSGETFETLAIVYTGRTLTPIHFAMSPRVPSRQKLGVSLKMGW